MNSLRKLFTRVALALCAVAVAATPAFAAHFPIESSNFGSCPNVGRTVIASYPDGEHGIVGYAQAKTGSDTVFYSETENVYTQCFCDTATGNGIQTNWTEIIPQEYNDDAVPGSLEWEQTYNKIVTVYTQRHGWTYVPNGAAWGLNDAGYLIKNVSYACQKTGGEVKGDTTATSTSSTNTSTATAQPATCDEQAPSSAPVLLSAVASGANQVTLTWREAADPVSYYLVAYGTKPGEYTYGNPNVGGKGTTSYTIKNLSGGTRYYFVVRAGNGCKPGPFSNEMTTQGTGAVITTQAEGFEAGVLGTTTEVEATPSGEVQGETITEESTKGCSACFWWPILLVEAIALYVLYVVRKENMTKMRWLSGAGIGVIALIIWWLLNRNRCANGAMDLVLFTLPCPLFVLLDAAVYGVFTTLMGKTPEKKEISKKK